MTSNNKFSETSRFDDSFIILKDAEVAQVTEENVFVEQTFNQGLQFTVLT